jgi:hypothetical protein
MQPLEKPWKPWQKIAFRFFFPFLVLSSYLCWDTTIYVVHGAFYHNQFDLGILYRPMAAVCFWLDKHIYHTGFNPPTQQGFPGDNHFGVVFYLTLLYLSIIIAIVWSTLDKKKNNYDRLYYWLCLYLRYALIIVMFGYGIDKLIPTQMMPPGVLAMTTPYGYLNRYFVLWDFMGMSPGYQIFTGACELVATFLLFSRRTAVFGYVLMAGILTNVAALNIFYNVTVKLFSAQLLLYTLFLLAPYASSIFRFFFAGGSKVYEQKQFVFKSNPKKYLLKSVLIAVPWILMLIIGVGTYFRYLRKTANAQREKIYDVTAIVSKDSLPAAMDDSVRWKRMLLNVYDNHAVIFTKDDQLDWYEYDIDSVKKTFSFHNGPDKKTWKVLNYTVPSKDQLQLTGNWKGRAVQVSMKVLPLESFPLNREKVKLVGD